jgi:hypothetical protein
MAKMQRAAQVGNTIYLCGIGTAAAALLYSFVIWSVWFVGPAEKTVSSSEFATAGNSMGVRQG